MEHVPENGDLYIDTYFGSIWSVESEELVKLNVGEILPLDNCKNMIYVGRILSIDHFDTEFYSKPDPCPICGSSTIMLVKDTSNLLWKIGCSHEECPCCAKHMSGCFENRATAIRRWNDRRSSNDPS